jgi:hypothetical protein
VATLAFVIAVSAQAQDYPAAPSTPGTPLPLPDGQRQHYVPGHFNGQGMYVAPHYEATKTLHFRGYYAADAQQRQAQKQHGYQEPGNTYTQPLEDTRGKKVEGR